MGTDFAFEYAADAGFGGTNYPGADIPEYFVTANLNYLMLTEQFHDWSRSTHASAAVIADGQPIVSRSRATDKPLPCRADRT
ncbi:MAG: hypothetical protein R3C56_28460 [Pirellulaceae bacterium]